MAINWFNDGSPLARSSTQPRFHAIVEAMKAEFEASWLSLSTVERQHALTALAQAKQFEVLLSAHVVEPEDALDHKHNSLVASVAQSVLGNSLKVDENAFRRSESERNRRLEEIRGDREVPGGASTARAAGYAI
jgi:restriction endonuclease Mrr